MKVLLVDDDKSFLDQFEDIDIGDHVDLVVYSDPTEALKNLTAERPDIIITDVMMPAIHGISFAEIVSSIIPEIEIVIISANSNEQIQKDLGVSLEKYQYFRKPLKSQFIEYLEKFISHHNSQKTEKSNSDAQWEKKNESIGDFTKAADFYIAYHDYCYKIYHDDTYDDFKSPQWEELEKKKTKLETALQILDLPGLEQRLFEVHGTYKNKMIENIAYFIPTTSEQRPRFPFQFVAGLLGSEYDGVWIKSFQCTYDDKFEPSLYVNGNQYKKLSSRFSTETHPYERIYRASQLFKLIAHRHCELEKTIKNIFEKISTGLRIFPIPQWKVSESGQNIEYYSNGVAFFEDGSNFKSNEFNSIPHQFRMEGERTTVRMKIDLENLQTQIFRKGWSGESKTEMSPSFVNKVTQQIIGFSKDSALDNFRLSLFYAWILSDRDVER